MMERIRRTENKRESRVSLTIVSFPLLAVGAGDAQDAVDGVGSDGIVGGAGHRGGGRAGH